MGSEQVWHQVTSSSDSGGPWQHSTTSVTFCVHVLPCRDSIPVRSFNWTVLDRVASCWGPPLPSQVLQSFLNQTFAGLAQTSTQTHCQFIGFRILSALYFFCMCQGLEEMVPAVYPSFLLTLSLLSDIVWYWSDIRTRFQDLSPQLHLIFIIFIKILCSQLCSTNQVRGRCSCQSITARAQAPPSAYSRARKFSWLIQPEHW